MSQSAVPSAPLKKLSGFDGSREATPAASASAAAAAAKESPMEQGRPQSVPAPPGLERKKGVMVMGVIANLAGREICRKEYSKR